MESDQGIAGTRPGQEREEKGWEASGLRLSREDRLMLRTRNGREAVVGLPRRRAPPRALGGGLVLNGTSPRVRAGAGQRRPGARNGAAPPACSLHNLPSRSSPPLRSPECRSRAGGIGPRGTSNAGVSSLEAYTTGACPATCERGAEPPQPAVRLSLPGREEISRGLLAGDSCRVIAKRLGRARSTVSHWPSMGDPGWLCLGGR